MGLGSTPPHLDFANNCLFDNMFLVAEIVISTKKITLIDYQKQNFILILVQLIIVKLIFF